MNAIDLITALGRLLRDGLLRDAFGADPFAVAGQLAVRESDRAAFCGLAQADLEFQALVLLRKRFREVRKLLPLTCGRLGEKAWSIFHKHARAHWPDGRNPAACDAHDFCRHLQQHQGDALCGHEWNRVRFALSGRWLAVFGVRSLPIRNRSRRAIQVFVRVPSGRWHEVALFLGL